MVIIKILTTGFYSTLIKGGKKGSISKIHINVGRKLENQDFFLHRDCA